MKDFSKIESFINSLNALSIEPKYSIEIFDDEATIYASTDTNLTLVYNLLFAIAYKEIIYLSIDDSRELFIKVRKL